MWLGPPAMNKKMTDLAFASCGAALGASGFVSPPPRSSPRHIEASASEPKPQKASRRKARRAGNKAADFSHRGTEARRGVIAELPSVPLCLCVSFLIDI